MHEIRIDDDILKILVDTAVGERRPFATHNEILRILLGLDHPSDSDMASASTTPDKSDPYREPLSTIPDSQGSTRTHQRIGPRLLREHGLTAKKGYFSKTGVPYSRPDVLPAVLFDPDGYLMVNDESSMVNSPHINVGKRVSIPGGISSVPGYVTCGHTHE